MKYFALSFLDNFGLESLWDVLGRKPAQLFGRECASSCVWTIVSLMIRFIIILVNLQDYVPRGIIFAFPCFIQFVARCIPFMKENIPLLPVRLAECMLGRFAPFHLMVVFPAHILGGIVGVALLQSILPSYYSEVLSPIEFSQAPIWVALLADVLVVTIYTVATIAVPEVLQVNKMSKYLLSLVVTPLLCFPFISQHSVINPAVVYALWYVRTRDGVLTSSALQPIQVEHILGPLMGAVVAGLICLRYFPDDASSWKRRL